MTESEFVKWAMKNPKMRVSKKELSREQQVAKIRGCLYAQMPDDDTLGQNPSTLPVEGIARRKPTIMEIYSGYAIAEKENGSLIRIDFVPTENGFDITGIRDAVREWVEKEPPVLAVKDIETEEQCDAIKTDDASGFMGWALAPKSVTTKGGEGSGHFGHAGRPGERGGSAPSGTPSTPAKDNDKPSKSGTVASGRSGRADASGSVSAAGGAWASDERQKLIGSISNAIQWNGVEYARMAYRIMKKRGMDTSKLESNFAKEFGEKKRDMLWTQPERDRQALARSTAKRLSGFSDEEAQSFIYDLLEDGNWESLLD